MQEQRLLLDQRRALELVRSIRRQFRSTWGWDFNTESDNVSLPASLKEDDAQADNKSNYLISNRTMQSSAVSMQQYVIT